MRGALLAGLLIGCGGMESPLSIVDDLRVLDLQTDPVAPVSGEPLAVEAFVLDALDRELDVWTAWCVGEVCNGVMLPPAPFVELRALACARDVCDPPADLSNPDQWLVGLPIEEVAYAVRRQPIDLPPNEPPVVGPFEAPESVAANEAVELTWTATDSTIDELFVYVYSTAGSWPDARLRFDEAGTASTTWTAPPEAGEVTLAFVVEDGLGGSTHGSRRVRVR